MSGKPKTGRALLLSILFHGGLVIVAVIAARQGLKTAFPEGNVEPVSIETVEPAPPAKAAEEALAPKAAVPKAAVVKQPTELPKAKMRAAPVPPPAAAPEEPETAQAQEDTQEESPVTAPPAEEVPPTPVQPEETPAATEPVPAPPAAEEAPATQAPAAQEPPAAVTPAPSTGTASASAKETVPQFGTPGTTLNEASLTARPGNRAPSYPYMARLRRQEGQVTLKAYVQKNGTLGNVTVYQSSGSPILDKEALEKYSTWLYEPGATGWVLKPFKFSLKDN